MDGVSDKSVVVAQKSVMFSGQQQQTYHFASLDDKKICPAFSVAGKFRSICKLFALFGFALSNQISDICKINLFRNGLILFISIQSFGH